MKKVINVPKNRLVLRQEYIVRVFRFFIVWALAIASAVGLYTMLFGKALTVCLVIFGWLSLIIINASLFKSIKSKKHNKNIREVLSVAYPAAYLCSICFGTILHFEENVHGVFELNLVQAGKGFVFLFPVITIGMLLIQKISIYNLRQCISAEEYQDVAVQERKHA